MAHDLAIVGLGLIGSAALRHAAGDRLDVVGIGPPEPDDWSSHLGPFASHYDSGRITRRLDARREWAILASRSIEQYRTIEEHSGIDFHEPAGLLFVRNDPDGIANQRNVARELELPVTVMDTDERQAQFPDLRFPSGWTTLHEPGPAGHIDPRRMVQAQQAVARDRGAAIRRAAATSLESTDDGFEITSDDGAITHSRRVILATGAYGNAFLPTPLATSVRPEAVVLAEVDAADVETTAGMPAFIYLLDHPNLDDVYVVPPVRYPDARWYIKMGGSYRRAARFTDPAEMNRWMAGNDADDQLDVMRDVLQTVLPTVTFTGWSMKPCLITDTVSDLPFVAQIDGGMVAAIGGNGHAAKSADAIGRLAVDLVRNERWTDPELDEAAFAARFGNHVPPARSRHGN